MSYLSSLTNTIAVDGTGKLPSSLMPDSVVGALNYQGTWNAATNVPHLQNGTGTKGHYYKVATQGTTDIGGINFWNLGDVISYNGSTWDRIDGGINEVVVGPQGPQGDPGPIGQNGNDGPPGPPGQTNYTWFAYANSADGISGFTTGTWSNQTYLGIAVNKSSPIESNVPSDYTWSKMQGPPGPQGTTGASGAAGPQGNSLYTWIAYADDVTGSTNFTTGPANGRLYIGLANNKPSSVEGTNPADYVWSKIAGEDGVPGTPGADGQTTYTWFAYANNATGTVGFTTGAWTNQTYLGLAANKLTSVESTNPADYFWSKIEGPQGPTGDPGINGVDGTRGSSKFYAVGSAWDDNVANNAVLAVYPAGKVTNDEVTISNGSTYAMTKVWNGSAWVAPGTVIDGNLLVSGSVSAAKINANGLTIRDPSGTIVLDASGGAALDWSKIFGAGRPADGATVGATFGSNISGQITAGNVSTYIAAAAIGDAYIGNLSANKITAGTLNASSYVEVSGPGSTTTRMGLLPDSTSGIRGTNSSGTQVFKLNANGLDARITQSVLQTFGSSYHMPIVAEGNVTFLTGGSTTANIDIPIPVYSGGAFRVLAQVTGYWENDTLTNAHALVVYNSLGIYCKNTASSFITTSMGQQYIATDTTSTTAWPTGHVDLLVVNEAPILRLTDIITSTAGKTVYSYIVWIIDNAAYPALTIY